MLEEEGGQHYVSRKENALSHVNLEANWQEQRLKWLDPNSDM